MTDPITPKKLREVGDDLLCGVEGRRLSSADAETLNAALRAAADEIDRLGRMLDEERPGVILTEQQRQIAMRLLSSPGAMVRIIEDEGAPKSVPLSPAEPRHRPPWAVGGDEYRAEQERMNRRSAALASLTKPTKEG